MITKYVLPLLRWPASCFAIYTVVQARQPPPQALADRRAADTGPTGQDDRRLGAGRGAAGEHPDRRQHPRRRHGGLRQER